uniref:Uncharacterized protein n=1 Tax=Arundo donax TaxID=35708 RepID=A0A0A9AJH6_ARUDO
MLTEYKLWKDVVNFKYMENQSNIFDCSDRSISVLERSDVGSKSCENGI